MFRLLDGAARYAVVFGLSSQSWSNARVGLHAHVSRLRLPFSLLQLSNTHLPPPHWTHVTRWRHARSIDRCCYNGSISVRRLCLYNSQFQYSFWKKNAKFYYHTQNAINACFSRTQLKAVTSLLLSTLTSLAHRHLLLSIWMVFWKVWVVGAAIQVKLILGSAFVQIHWFVC